MADPVANMGKVVSKTPVSGLGERTEVDDSLDLAMQRIEMLLAQRENKQYNPTLLAIAQGFLAPSATGSFGEGAGAAAGNVLKIQEQEQKQGMENAQMRLQLAQAQKEQANLRTAQKDFARTTGIGGQPQAGAPGAPAAPGAPGAGQPAPQLRPLSEDDVLAFSQRNPSPNGQKLATLMLESIKLRRGKFAISAQGQIVDLDTSTVVGGQQQSEYSTPFGTFPMTPNQFTKFELAQNKGLGKEWIDAYRSGRSTDIDKLTAPMAAPDTTGAPAVPGAPGAPGAAPVVDPNRPKPPMMLSKEEKLGNEKEAEALAKGRADDTRKAIDAGKDAFLRKQTAQTLQDLYIQEGMEQVSAVLERPGLIPAILKMAEDGVRLGGGYGISVPQVRDIFTANKISLPKIAGESKADYDARIQGVLDRVAQAGSLFAQITFGLRSLAQGQGAISNFEQIIFNQMAPGFRDSVATIMAKTKHMAERANFDQAVRDSLLDSGMSYDRFSRTPEYQNAVKQYDAKIKDIYSGVKMGGAPAAAGRPAAPAGPAAPTTKSAYEQEKDRRAKGGN
jgi:hypothetical protein